VQSVVGGSAHLLNFDGSDTMSASYHTQFHLNKGKPVSAVPSLDLGSRSYLSRSIKFCGSI